jgi:hypothetical protein
MIEIEDFVDKKTQDLIEDTVTSAAFHWHFNHHTIEPYLIEELANKKYIIPLGDNPYQFCHSVVVDSKKNTEYLDLIQPVINQLARYLKKDIEIQRAKFNFLSQSNSTMYHWPHVDDKPSADMKSLIYYVTDADGDTFLFKEKAPIDRPVVTIDTRVMPKKGKALMFDSHVFHASSSPNKFSKRIVLNIVFKIL